MVLLAATLLAGATARVARADDLTDPYAASAPPAPPVPVEPTVALARANAAVVAGDWDAVERHIAPLLPGAALGKGDRAELHRLAGLAAFFHDRLDDAEAEFLAYLKLDIDGRLDPATVPPEAITFFEDVRARHGAELRALRPRGRGPWVLNFLPPVGQFQNGDKVKGWIIGGGLVALVATNITTYLVLRSWCGNDERLCEPGGDNKADSARALRTINVTTGVLAIGLYAYGVIDGIRGYRRRGSMLTIEPRDGGGVLMLNGRF
jgi:hypothetical protein